MNKSLIYVNLPLELLVVSTFSLVSHTSGTFSLYFAQPSYELERSALKMHILWCRTDISSCKLSLAKVPLMLYNPFSVPALCKLNHISMFVSSRLAQKSPVNSLFPSEKAMFFWSDPQCFGPLGNFQHNIKISIETARVSRLLFVSCNNGKTNISTLKFLYQTQFVP